MNTAFSRRVSQILLVALLAAFSAGGVVSAKDAAGSAATEGKYLLRYKFVMGEVLRYDVRHVSNVRTTIESETQQVESQSDSVKAWKVTDVLPSGEMEFVHLVEWVRMTNQKPQQAAVAFDSRSGDKPPRGFEQAAGAVGVPLSLIRISPDGAVTFREEKHPQPKPTEDVPITLQLSKAPVAVGEKWNHPYDVQVERKSGAKLQIRTRRVCKLRQVKNGVATIDVEYQVLTPIDSYVRAQLVERLTEGTVQFDVERGRIIGQQHNVDKRVMGFAGSASSMHFVSRLEEKLLPRGEQLVTVTQASAQATK